MLLAIKLVDCEISQFIPIPLTKKIKPQLKEAIFNHLAIMAKILLPLSQLIACVIFFVHLVQQKQKKEQIYHAM